MFRQSQIAEAPEWFTAALDQKPEHHDTEVDGCRIHLRAWGTPGSLPLVFVHGGGAHSGWWDHIAPFFCTTHRVIAPDLSGHGDSGTRRVYHLRTWAEEVVAVSKAAGASGGATIVGHSLGGLIASRAAQHYGRELDSIVIVDSPLRDHAPEQTRLQNRKPNNGYQRRKDILARFVPVPDQRLVLTYVREHVAAESIRRTLTGWTWKFDPAVFDAPQLHVGVPDEQIVEHMLSEMPCRIGFLRCEQGLVTDEMAQRIMSILQLRGPFIELPLAGHHPMFDQPVAFAAAVRTLLEMWSIS